MQGVFIFLITMISSTILVERYEKIKDFGMLFFITGMFLGAGFLHRIDGVSTPKAVPFNGKISLIAGLIFMLVISVYYSRKKNNA